MTLAESAEGNTMTLTINGSSLSYGKLTMQDFASLSELMPTKGAPFNEVLRWCQSPAGCLSVVATAAAKCDPTANEEAVNGLGTPIDIAEAAIDILNASNGSSEEENQEDHEKKEPSGPNPTG